MILNQDSVSLCLIDGKESALLPASLHKGSVRLRRPYRGGGLLEKLARPR